MPFRFVCWKDDEIYLCDTREGVSEEIPLTDQQKMVFDVLGLSDIFAAVALAGFRIGERVEEQEGKKV